MAKKKAKPESPQVSDLQAMWLDEITRYETEADRWARKARNVVKRYKDDRDKYDYRVRFNILWSNIQVLKPALYSQDPIPRVERRFKDNNPIAKAASDILERCLSYAIECTKYGDIMRQCVHDRLLVGRGSAWVRYVPHFRDVELQETPEIAADGLQITEDQEDGEPEDEQTEQQLYYEEAIPDFVHWEDFGHTFGRTWEEIRGIWRIAYMTRDELNERFGEKLGREVPLDYDPWSDKRQSEAKKVTENMKRACIYEIWDKQTKQVIWLSKGMQDTLDVRDDPLGLEEFFPCPKPMLANLANDTVIPTPDYLQYQDQAMELDELTGRVANISKSIKVAGVYDQQAEGVQRIFTEGAENKLIPVAQWTRFAERGGLGSAMDLLPTKEMAETLLALYDARERTKNDLYEITGISDIVRGFSSGGSKTATEQQIKSQFANLRLSESQREVQLFARDLLKVMGEIIAFKFSPETILKISGVKLLNQHEKQQIQMQQQMAQAQAQKIQAAGMPPPPVPPLPPDVAQAMQQPSIEEVMELLRNHADFGFSIEIETDSTINTDLQYQREQTNELITALGGFGQGVSLLMQEGVISREAAIALLNTTLKKHHMSKEVEEALDIQPQPQQNPEAQKQQQQLQDAQNQLAQQKNQNQMDAMKNSHDKAMLALQIKQHEAGKAQADAMGEVDKERQKVENEAVVQKIQAIVDSFTAQAQGMQKQHEAGAAQAQDDKQKAQHVEMAGQVNQMQQTLAELAQQVIKAMQTPKQIVRGPDGRAVGIAPAPSNVQ